MIESVIQLKSKKMLKVPKYIPMEISGTIPKEEWNRNDNNRNNQGTKRRIWST